MREGTFNILPGRIISPLAEGSLNRGNRHPKARGMVIWVLAGREDWADQQGQGLLDSQKCGRRRLGRVVGEIDGPGEAVVRGGEAGTVMMQAYYTFWSNGT